MSPRHGLRLDRIDKSYKDDPNPPLHHSGIEAIINSSKKIHNLDAVFTSPFIRCVQTAHLLNSYDAPIFIEYGLSETLKERWFTKCGYNPLNRLNNSREYQLQYYNVDAQYTTKVHQSFPESRRESRRRTAQFMDWLKKSEYWEKDILLVGHGFSIKDCLNELGINPPFQGWDNKFPAMGHLFSIKDLT